MSESLLFPAPRLLTSSEEVAAYCAKLQNELFVAIDTEFVRERTYWPQLCLVQLAGKEDVVLIDACAADIDLTPLGALLAKSDCIKVFHAARQDLEIFFHIFGRLPVNVFDTQIAAMVAGFGEQIGYDSLVFSVTGKSLDKAHRFSDWAMRPLSKAQRDYASADVTYLRVVYTRLHRQLVDQGRLAWVESELASLVKEETFLPDPRRLWERLKPRTNNRRMLGVLRELAVWRENVAQKVDLPRQRIIRDESLLEIAAVRPRELADLNRIRGISHQFIDKWGDDVLCAVSTGEGCAEQDLPELALKKKFDHKVPQGILTLLKALLAARCEEHKVAARLVASSADLEHLALGVTMSGAAEIQALPVLHGWRGALFGHEAQALLAGKVALFVENGELSIQKREIGPDKAEKEICPVG